ncbi:MAG TPA: hypothetical protein VNX68_06710 [Nitrosopumilaceae archaeon]|jgi:hypothetical protein|nr:hypothetical protein [Nitrosopumilaceae archaeon]
MALTYDQQLYYRRSSQDLGVPEGALNFKSDSFTGDGVTIVFILSHSPDQTNFTPIVIVNNVTQGTSQIVIVGTNLTFAVAPALNAIIQVNYQF